MNRYTTKHFWRMEDSEEGEWVRYEEHQKLIEIYNRQYKSAHKHIAKLDNSFKKYSRHLESRLLVLFYVLMATYGVIVAKLIGWSLGL